MDPDDGAPDKEGVMTILDCPQCFANRAAILDTKPPTARCADCDTTYRIKYTHVEQPASEPEPSQPASPSERRKKGQQKITPAQSITLRDVGSLTEYVEEVIKGGPDAILAPHHELDKITKRLGQHIETEWYALCTPW